MPAALQQPQGAVQLVTALEQLVRVQNGKVS
jgi:hypothetical protein